MTMGQPATINQFIDFDTASILAADYNAEIVKAVQAPEVKAKLEAAGIENLESVFFNRWGQFIYREPRGRHAGYPVPEVGIHRGRLHRILYEGVGIEAVVRNPSFGPVLALAGVLVAGAWSAFRRAW